MRSTDAVQSFGAPVAAWQSVRRVVATLWGLTLRTSGLDDAASILERREAHAAPDGMH